MIGDGLPSPIFLVQLRENVKVDKHLARDLWHSVSNSQEHQPAYSALSANRVVVLAPAYQLPTSAKGNVIRAQSQALFEQGVNEVDWTSFLQNQGSGGTEQFDSLDFTRAKSIQAPTEEYEVCMRFKKKI